jgi:hypothetical protein
MMPDSSGTFSPLFASLQRKILGIRLPRRKKEEEEER